jgi:putative hydrolase of the HAD superfamily
VIKAIIFDYFGVISSDEYWQFVKQDRKTNSQFRNLADEVNLGQIHWQAFIQKVASATGKTVEEVDELYATERINPLMVTYIKQLRARYKTGLLTNAHHEFIDALFAKSKLETLFDAVVISSRIGMIKPDPHIFQYILDKLGVKPAEAIYIDDLERHTAAGNRVGMHTILYKDLAQMKHELNQMLTM